MKSFRMNRLFDPVSQRCFVVAIDHGIFNEPGFLQGIENLENAVRVLVAANPNVIQLNIGQAHQLQSLPGKAKPALIMRTDLANVYSSILQSQLFSKMADDAAEQAVRLDAAAVIVNLIQLPGHPEVTAQCIDNILRLKPQCDRFCMPMIVEPSEVSNSKSSPAIAPRRPSTRAIPSPTWATVPTSRDSALVLIASSCDRRTASMLLAVISAITLHLQLVRSKARPGRLRAARKRSRRCGARAC